MVVPFPVVFCTTMTFGLEVMGMVVIFVVVPVTQNDIDETQDLQFNGLRSSPLHSLT